MLDSLFAQNFDNRAICNVHQYLVIACVVSVCVWYIQLLWRRRKLYMISRNIPGPPAYPLIGSLHYFLGKPPSDVLAIALDLMETYATNGIAKVWFGSELMFLVIKPDYIGIILNNPNSIEKEKLFYGGAATAIGQSLLTAKAKQWRKNRKLISPSFNQRILNTFVEIFAEQGAIFAEQLQKTVGQKEIDLYLLTCRCTLDIICETAMGVEMNIQKGDSKFGHIVERMFELLVYRAFRIWYHVDFIWNMSPLSKEMSYCIHEFWRVTGKVVVKKMEQTKRKKQNQDNSLVAEIEEEPVKKRLAFLDLVLEDCQLTERELKDEVRLFLVAGTETTAGTLSFVFTVLGVLQDVQQKVYQEVMDTIGPDKAIEATDLAKLTYTERVIKETLRMFPLASFFGRLATNDIDLGDVKIPKGASVMLAPVHVHRNSEFWPDPLKFDPDRFLPENVAARHPYAYLPFSAGPRNCIGWRYAMMSMKVMVASVVRRVRLFSEYKSLEDIELKISLLLRMKHGPKVWVETR